MGRPGRAESPFVRAARSGVRVLPEEALEILFNLHREILDRRVAELGEGGGGGGEVGGMVDGRTVGRRRERKFFEGRGQAHGGSIGLDEEAVGRDAAENLQPPEVPRRYVN